MTIQYFDSDSELEECDRCGKKITGTEGTESCLKMRKAIPKDHQAIFDVWLLNYCDDCADRYIRCREWENSPEE